MEENIFDYQKNDDYKMMHTVSGEYRDFLLKIINDPTVDLDQYNRELIEKANIYSFFDVVKKEFNEYTDNIYDFDLICFYSNEYIEVSLIDHHIFTNAILLNTLLPFYTILLFQADHLENEKITKRCFQNIFGMIKDSCLYDCEYVSRSIYKFIDEIGYDQNYIFFASDFLYVSIAFLWLHEMSHLHYKHKQIDNISQEMDADRLATAVLLNIISKNENNKFLGGCFNEVFHFQDYLCPIMALDFYHIVTLINKRLYKSEIPDSKFEEFIKRKAILQKYIQEEKGWTHPIGTLLFESFEESLNCFCRNLIPTDLSGKLEEYKTNGGCVNE